MAGITANDAVAVVASAVLAHFMKKLLHLPFLCAALVSLVGCATTSTPSLPAETVHVQVDLPPGVSPLYSDRIAEAFTDEVRHVFIQAGFKRPVETLLYVDEKARLENVLRINLLEWRFDRLGNTECRFTAQLQTPQGSRYLGAYSGTSMGISRTPGFWGALDSFDEAAQDALGDLIRTIVKSDLLPKRPATPPAPTAAGKMHV